MGELGYHQRLIGKTPEKHVMTTALVVAGGERHAFPMLDRARLLQIRGNGLLITTIENIKADDYPKTWWCVPYVYIQGDEPEPVKTPTKLGWREQSGIEHAQRWGLPLPSYAVSSWRSQPERQSRAPLAAQ